MLMILARLVRSESFWAVVKVRSPHTGPGIRYIIALLAHGHQLRLLLVVHAEHLHARGGAMSIGRGRGVWRGGRLAPSSSGRPPP